MNIAMLSLAQTPPLMVPLRLFLIAPLFAVLGMGVLIMAPEAILMTRWSAEALVVVHLIVLGFITMVMLGALQQLIPVLIGVVIEESSRLSLALALFWGLGTLLLVGGFWLRSSAFTVSALWSLGIGLSFLLFYLLRALWQSPSRHPTVLAMLGAIVSLALTYLIALLVLGKGGWSAPVAHPWTSLHLSWGLLGWMGLLLMGVGYQVVPMFQITPDFPPPLRRWLGPSLFISLLLLSISSINPTLGVLFWPALVLMAGTLLTFAVTIFYLQWQRKRRLPDASVNLWRIAMGSLLLAIIFALPGLMLSLEKLLYLAWVTLVFGTVIPAMSGMLLKIIPFLIWLHLNNQAQQRGDWQAQIPNMKQIIPEIYGVRIWKLQIFALLLMLAAMAMALPWLLQLAAIVWGVAFLQLLQLSLLGLRCYRGFTKAF